MINANGTAAAIQPEPTTTPPLTGPGRGTTLTTYSMWNAFRNCRRACEWRYIKNLVPIERNSNLSFGSLVHSCLEKWHGGANLETVLQYIEEQTPARYSDDYQRQTWHLARAMMTGYAQRYPTEQWEVVALELTFEGRIVNPRTGRPSRALSIAGKVDGLIKLGCEYYLLEHKTASAVDSNYLDRLWTDLQIALYAHYAEECWGVRISGVIYNVLIKARLQQNKGETQLEFEARRDALLAASKTGKTTATTKLPESDEAYQHRLLEKYLDPSGEMFHRQMLYISREQLDQARSDIWSLAQQFLDARRTGDFNRNTGSCFRYNAPCSYLPLCQANGNAENLIENMYEVRLPHEELASATNPTDDREEAF